MIYCLYKHQFFSIPLLKCSSAAFVIFAMVYFRSLAPKILLPATIQFAPDSAASFVVSSLSPPSTWISISGNCFRIYFTLGSTSAINFCAPKPGYTVITRILSISPSLARSIKIFGTGVAGLILTPAAILCYFIFCKNCLRSL